MGRTGLIDRLYWEHTGIPQFVKDEFDAYLECGILAHDPSTGSGLGFLRLRCEGCARELLVAFSCKLRGICPSCADIEQELAALDRATVEKAPAKPLRCGTTIYRSATILVTQTYTL